MFINGSQTDQRNSKIKETTFRSPLNKIEGGGNYPPNSSVASWVHNPNMSIATLHISPQ